MNGLLNLEEHQEALKGIEIQRRALRQARDVVTQKVPKLPTVERMQTRISFINRDPNTMDAISEPVGVKVMHLQNDSNGRTEWKELNYYFGKEDTAKDLRDCLCKLLGAPTADDLNSVQVKMI